MYEALGTKKGATNPAWCYSRDWGGEERKGREGFSQKGTSELGFEE